MTGICPIWLKWLILKVLVTAAQSEVLAMFGTGYQHLIMMVLYIHGFINGLQVELTVIVDITNIIADP